MSLYLVCRYITIVSLVFIIGGCSLWNNHSFTVESAVEYNLKESTLPVKLRWIHQFQEDVSNPPFIQNDELIYVRTQSTLYAVEPQTGREKWKHKIGNATDGYDMHNRVIAYKNLVLTVTERETVLQALDRETGIVRWDLPLYEFIDGRTQRPQIIQIIVEMGRAYVLVNLIKGTAVLAIDANNGEVLWRSPNELSEREPFALPRAIYSDPASHQLIVDNGMIWYLEKGSGQIIDVKSVAISTYLPPALSDGVLYTSGEVVQAIVLQTMRTKWRFKDECAGLDDQVFTSPVVVEQAAYVLTTCKLFYKLNTEDGHIEWKIEANTAPRSFVVFKKQGYLLLQDGSLHAINLDSGQEIGVLSVEPRSVPSATYDHLTANEDILILSYGNGQLFAFEPK